MCMSGGAQMVASCLRLICLTLRHVLGCGRTGELRGALGGPEVTLWRRLVSGPKPGGMRRAASHTSVGGCNNLGCRGLGAGAAHAGVKTSGPTTTHRAARHCCRAVGVCTVRQHRRTEVCTQQLS